MDVDNDDEYMDAAAAHAAFVSSKNILIITSCTVHATQIFISYTHFLKKVGLGSADSLHSGITASWRGVITWAVLVP